MNRKEGEKNYVWKFNLGGCEEMFIDYLNISLWDFLKEPPPSTRVEFVVATKSNRWYVELQL